MLYYAYILYIYMLSHTIIIYFLYTFAILHKLFSKTWYMHPWFYNSANYVLSAENAIPQTVKTPPWNFTAQLKCHWHLNICHLLTPQSIFCFSSCLGTIFWSIGMCSDIYFFSPPIKTVKSYDKNYVSFIFKDSPYSKKWYWLNKEMYEITSLACSL